MATPRFYVHILEPDVYVPCYDVVYDRLTVDDFVNIGKLSVISFEDISDIGYTESSSNILAPNNLVDEVGYESVISDFFGNARFETVDDYRINFTKQYNGENLNGQTAATSLGSYPTEYRIRLTNKVGSNDDVKICFAKAYASYDYVDLYVIESSGAFSSQVTWCFSNSRWAATYYKIQIGTDPHIKKYDAPPKKLVNFYRSTPPRDEKIVLERGQSIEIGFTAVYEGTEGEPYTGTVTWNNPYPDEISISGNTITVSETARNPSIQLTAYPSEHEEGDTLYDFVVINVSNPLGVYDTGGITGGQNQTGGGGSYGRLPDGSIEQSDTIDIPNGTVASPATATGFFTRYLADTNTISTFGRWLWTTDLGLQVAKAVISLIYGDPAQSVISLMSYPFNIASLPGVLQSTGNIIWGNFNSNIVSDVLNSQASQIDWGTIQLSEYWGNFLDYSPHTKVSLYLPWGTGFVDLDPGECLPGTLNVKTNIDFSKGSCVHNVIGNGNLIGSFAGQCAQQIPVLSSDFASKVAGLVTAAAAGISASAVGGAGVLAEAAMGFPNATISGGDDKVLASFSDAKRAAGRIATTSLAINRHPVNVTRNGGFTDGSAALGCQYPYVIISRPKQSMPEQYGSHFGYPSNIYRQLGTLRGYTEVGEIHLEGIPATDAELSELDRILKGGVIF